MQPGLHSSGYPAVSVGFFFMGDAVEIRSMKTVKVYEVEAIKGLERRKIQRFIRVSADCWIRDGELVKSEKLERLFQNFREQTYILQWDRQKKRIEKDSSFEYLAKQLAEVVNVHVKINSNAKPIEWARSLRLLHERDGVAKKRIEIVIDGYGEIIGEKYTPEAFSGRAFRTKFARIEKAIKRKRASTDYVPSTPTAAVYHRSQAL